MFLSYWPNIFLTKPDTSIGNHAKNKIMDRQFCKRSLLTQKSGRGGISVSMQSGNSKENGMTKKD